ncbi:hypothetical protein pb186bvf_017892 [Paramecium bursaria]
MNSFFDDNQCPWQNIKSFEEDDIFHKCQLEYQNKRTMFAFTNLRLIRYKGNKPYKYLELFKSSIQKPNETTIMITRNKKAICLKDQNIQNINFLYDQLRQRGIQNNIRTNYDIGQSIGQGQFANVYKVINRNTGCSYAAKVFKIKGADKDSIQKEIQIMRMLKHPRIIKIYEIYEDQEYLFLILELMQTSLKNAKINTERQWALVILQIFKTLRYIHENKIIHRDIKPDNILLKDADNIAICDFGLADYYNPQSVYQYQRCGTPGYVAPEILRDMKYDYKVDVYSTGIILYTMIVGKQPFSAQSQTEIVKKNFSGFIDFSLINASSLCIQFLQQILQINPALRPSSFEVVHHEWFRYALGEQQYFQMMNKGDCFQKSNHPETLFGQLEQVQNFQAIQNMMDEESDQEPEQQPLQQAIYKYQNLISEMKQQQQLQDGMKDQHMKRLSYIADILQQQHRQMTNL